PASAALETESAALPARNRLPRRNRVRGSIILLTAMKTWKIHFCWALIAMGASGAWGRWSVVGRDSRLHPREESASLPDPSRTSSQVGSSLVAVAAPSRLEPRTALRLPPDFRLLPDPNERSLDEIRALMKSENHRDLYFAADAIKRLKDPALQRELLLEMM